MNRSPSNRKNFDETAAIASGGGFSLLIFSPMVLFICLLTVLMSGAVDYSEVLNASSNGTTASAPIAEPPPSRKIARLFTPEVQHWAADIARWSNEYGVDANLIATVMQIESCGDPLALSRAGAQGLFQVMPFHFGRYEQPFEPEINALRGVSYLGEMFADFGSVRLALAAYNGGPGTAGRLALTWPDETKRYVYWGENIYADAVRDKQNSAVLDEWLSAGGASLCAQARGRLGLAP
jgi:soluble lytic murein transglycosylase-like protein